MFQTIEERKAAVSDPSKQTHKSLTEEDSYVGELFRTGNLHADIPFCLQLFQSKVRSNQSPLHSF